MVYFNPGTVYSDCSWGVGGGIIVEWINAIFHSPFILVNVALSSHSQCILLPLIFASATFL